MAPSVQRFKFRSSTDDMSHDKYEMRREMSSHARVLIVSLSLLMLLSIAWNVFLSLRQAKLSQHIAHLEERQRKLFSRCSGRPFADPDDGERSSETRVEIRTPEEEEFIQQMALVKLNAQSETSENDVRHRGKREVTGERKTKEKEKRNKRREKHKRQKNKVGGAHFVAYVDGEKLYREIAEGKPQTTGTVTKHGFQPKERIYNIWKPMDWSNRKLFQYNSTSGKVKVKSTGLYLIYAQVMFHSSSFRRSYGIHINDESVPYIEALSFDGRTRHRRHAEDTGPSLDQEWTAAFNRSVDDAGQSRRRPRRSHSVSYSQCNTMAIAFLKKDDDVFLKSLEFSSSLIPQHYLTFWGIVRL